jgi:hypothetical protein
LQSYLLKGARQRQENQKRYKPEPDDRPLSDIQSKAAQQPVFRQAGHPRHEPQSRVIQARTLLTFALPLHHLKRKSTVASSRNPPIE